MNHTPISATDLDVIEARALASTPDVCAVNSGGNLFLELRDAGGQPICTFHPRRLWGDAEHRANWRFYGAARTDVVRLVAEVRRLRTQVEARPLTNPEERTLS